MELSRTGALVRAVASRYREMGLWRTFRLGVRKLLAMIRALGSSKDLHPFDLKYGTETSGVIESWSLDLPQKMIAHAARYQTAIVEVYLEILNSLPITHQEFVFIDLGSGKGRALLLASCFPFKQIIGVELSPRLHEIACENIRRYRDGSQRCHKILSICEDATEYEIPKENVVFYMFNPFDDEVMSSMILNIERSLRSFPRRMYIMYLKPVCRHLFDRTDWLRTVKATDRYVIYETKQAYYSADQTREDGSAIQPGRGTR